MLSAGKDLKECSDILKEYHGTDWQTLVQSQSQQTNTRILIDRNDYIDAVLICWSTGRFSGIHDHPADGCLLKVLEGTLVEHRFPDWHNKPHILHVNDISYMDGNQRHNIGAIKGTAVSLHIYSPPGYRPNYYPQSRTRLRLKTPKTISIWQ